MVGTHTDLQTILQEVRTFVDEHILPLEPIFLKEGWDAVRPKLDVLRTKVKEMGYFTPQIHREDGGLGLSNHQFGQVSEILGRVTPMGHYVFNCQAPDAGNMEILISHGTPAQKEQFLKPLLAGEIRSCFAMTEPEFAGSNPKYMGTTAILEGDHYILNGHKWFTTGADGSTFAIVMCVTNPEEENPYLRASQLIVPLNTEGFVHERRIPIMGDEGEGWASHSEIRFENCRVPKENLLGGAGKGFVIAQERLGPGRIHHCMRWIGIAERAFEMMCARAATRKLGSNRLLAHQQTIQNWIAESRAEIHAARLMVLDAADKIDKEGAYKARVEISTIKFFTAKVMQDVVDRAIQVHGALGTTEDTILSFLFRHERGARIYDGADEVHKSRVAREILKPYGVKL
ncbi:MAG: acyl-CoA dehydrogenase family protein [Bacteroidota bacterium]